jgi:uncharacterized cupredoxin-like copper-binding protein
MEMQKAKPVLSTLLAAWLLSFGAGALAHGESGHGKPKAVDYAKAEETPFGRAGDPRKVSRTIRIAMADSMHFAVAGSPGQRAADVRAGSAPHAVSGDIVVKRGETIRFVARNDGSLMHEMVIGTMKRLRDHAELMRKFPEMEHDEPYMAHVAPGKQGEIVWQFTRAGEFHYACLVPGHMEAGMISKITVK